MEAKPTTLSFICCYCRNELNESQIFEFRTALGCEDCVRAYYRSSSPKELESQLHTRRRNALIWLANNRKALEKQLENEQRNHPQSKRNHSRSK
jgi:hypothetical protein